MATERTTNLTYDDLLETFPEEDNIRVGEVLAAAEA